jgi:hypothetical protein
MLKAKRQEKSMSHPGPDEAPPSGPLFCERFRFNQTNPGAATRIAKHIKKHGRPVETRSLLSVVLHDYFRVSSAS